MTGCLKFKKKSIDSPSLPPTSNIIGSDKTLFEQIPDKIKEGIIIADYNSYIDKNGVRRCKLT